MKYVIVRADGVVEIRQDSGNELPEGAIEVSDEDYAALVVGEKCFMDGAVVPCVLPVL